MVPNQVQQQEEQEEQQFDITQSPAAIITIVVLSLLFLGAIAFFGYQTWLFVNWLLPEDGLMMKILAVVNFDVFSYVWLAVGLFLARWIQPLTRTLAVLAGIVTFLLSLGCSVIQMLIASAERFGTNTNPDLVYTADAFIILALVWNISTLLGVVHIQWPYIIGYHPPKKPKKQGRGLFGLKKQPSSTPVQASVTQASSIDYDALAQAVIRQTGVLPAVQPQHPLAQPPLDTTASQPGSQNGNTNGHQKSQA